MWGKKKLKNKFTNDEILEYVEKQLKEPIQLVSNYLFVTSNLTSPSLNNFNIEVPISNSKLSKVVKFKITIEDDASK